MTASDIACIDHLMAGGEMLSSQVRASSLWSPEKRLAGAVLASALVCVRDRHADPRYAEAVEEDLAWISSDDSGDPFSFLLLCDLFGLEPAWVRETVARWCRSAPQQRRVFSLSRDAA